MIAAALQRYLGTSEGDLQQSILLLLATLVDHEVQFSALDKDQTFFRHLLAQVQHGRALNVGVVPMALIAKLHLEVPHVSRRPHLVRNPTYQAS